MKSISPLPKVEIHSIEARELFKMIQQAQKNHCRDSKVEPQLTLLDFRNENFLSEKDPPPRIHTQCATVFLRLDDIRDPDTRARIPKTGTVVTVTETGNRDDFVIRYLSVHGFRNIKALKFGMRGWLKSRYPIEELAGD